ncbi:MAG: metallophosphoesterase [Lachnospiraceae bacterium]|nr:metallophosphoesterase [Lachnospiraceae bacterium]
MSNYVISDIHNDNGRLLKMLKKIRFSDQDHLFILGDLFDRGGSEADPVGVYHTLLGLGENVSYIKGNHDLWLANYIKEYYQLPPKKRAVFREYYYNSFRLMYSRLTQVDMLEIADTVLKWPLQKSVVIEGQKYLFAHAMTSPEDQSEDEDHYLMGLSLDFKFLRNGIDGYVSVCGHNPTPNIRAIYGDDVRPKKPEIWHNTKENVYMIDCGCGFVSGRLACMRLEDKQEFYA